MRSEKRKRQSGKSAFSIFVGGIIGCDAPDLFQLSARVRAREGQLVSPAVIGRIRCLMCGDRQKKQPCDDGESQRAVLRIPEE